jgi:cytochrome P450/NADPH-cytochrome P450 reductase
VGTGIAPLRAMLYHLQSLRQAAHSAGRQPRREVTMYFGCRHPERDFICEEELKAFQRDGVSRAFPSWNRTALTEIYLCHACSYHEFEDHLGIGPY